jgi:hypothetical protein
VALTVGEVQHPPPAHQRGRDALACFLGLTFQNAVLAAMAFVNHVRHTCEIVLPGAWAVGGIVPEREACIPAHQATAVGRDEACELVNQALLVALTEAVVCFAQPFHDFIGRHGPDLWRAQIGVDAKARVISFNPQTSVSQPQD